MRLVRLLRTFLQGMEGTYKGTQGGTQALIWLISLISLNLHISTQAWKGPGKEPPKPVYLRVTA